jgi:membrane associated rhomboid family serine protease
VTHAFLHGDVLHLLYNLFALALFGSILEKIIESKRFLILLFSSILFSAFASLLFYPASLGISGAIFGILACLAVLRPTLLVWVFGVPMPIIIALIFWSIINFAGLFFPSNIAYASHLAGMIVGILYGLKLRKSFVEPKEEKVELDEEEFMLWEEKWVKRK